MNIFLKFIMIAITVSGCSLKKEPVDYHWLAFHDDNTYLFSAIIKKTGTCPTLKVNNRKVVMEKIEDKDDIAICRAFISRDAKRISAYGKDIKLANNSPKRILVIGDTGCRHTKLFNTDCRDDKQWGFPKVAAAAAHHDVDLIIHTGDILYMSVYDRNIDVGGDGSWKQWEYEFFNPAQPLLNKAPWIFVRGNHENCVYFGRLRALIFDGNNDVCQDGQELQHISFDRFDLLNIDSSNIAEGQLDRVAANKITQDIKEKGLLPDKDVIVLTHKPVIHKGLKLMPGRVENLTLFEAVEQNTQLNSVMYISGHVHVMQTDIFADAPPQIVIGNGGADLHGKYIYSNKINDLIMGRVLKDRRLINEYGFAIINVGDNAYDIAYYDYDNKHIMNCVISRDRKTNRCSSIAK